MKGRPCSLAWGLLRLRRSAAPPELCSTLILLLIVVIATPHGILMRASSDRLAHSFMALHQRQGDVAIGQVVFEPWEEV